MACNSNETETVTDETDTNVTAETDANTTDNKDTKNYCFVKATGDDVTRQDSTFINLTITGNKVTGEKHWHPFEKDGAHGTLEGTKNGALIKALYSYTIEGSQQTEELIFSLGAGKLLQKVGELEDDFKGNLKLKDPAAAKFVDEYTRVLCNSVKLH